MAYRKNDIQTTTVANGDLSGTFGSTTVAKLNGVTVTGMPAVGQVVTATSATAATWQSGSSFYAYIFGNGSGGVVILDGTTTYSNFASLSGSTYTLITKAVLLPPSSLTINSGVTLNTAGLPLQATGTITNNGTITNAGGNASGATGGTKAASFLYGAQASRNGTSAAGSAGFNQTSTLAAGVGGTGGSGTSGSGGTAGTAASTTSTWAYTSPQTALTGNATFAGTNAPIFGGTGGGSGAGDGTNSGGGSGPGGGTIALLAHSIINNGIITAGGGNGGTPPTGNCGGGGGGGGGNILIYSLSAMTGSGTTNVSGGTGGTGVGSGTSGTSGGVGQVLQVVLV